MIYKIFNTSNKTIYNVITLKKHAFNTLPNKYPLKKGDIILICDEQKEIHFLMFYKDHHNDIKNESQNFFLKKILLLKGGIIPICWFLLYVILFYFIFKR